MLDQAKLQHLADLITTQTELRFVQDGFTAEIHRPSWQVSIIPGRKFTKIDVGRSGRYMIDNETGDIYGIKAYGVVHRGHWYGTLDTVNAWKWGDYTAVRRPS